jgi:hypothetical protein
MVFENDSNVDLQEKSKSALPFVRRNTGELPSWLALQKPRRLLSGSHFLGSFHS